MSATCTIVKLAGVIALGLLLHSLHDLIKPLAAPKLDDTQFWGVGQASSTKANNADVRAKKIHYDAAVIDRLRRKLLDNTTEYHAALDGSELHGYGIDTQVFRDFVAYWGGEYLDKWPARQAMLNSVPHFTTEIQGLNIHFVHLKPKPTRDQVVLPLLLLHGWPGSVREFYEIFPMLVAPEAGTKYAFEVIAPSLPGYGWSDGAAKVGFGPAEAAVVLRNLMLRLGHSRFYIQGGDWGSIIGSHLATLYPANVIGYHSNFCLPKTLRSTLKLLVASLWPTAFVDEQYVEQVFPLGDKAKLIVRETGSFHIQATKPETLSAVLYSPLALGAYLQEKFISALPEHDVDAILDNIMIYYLTDSFATGARLYAEDVSAAQTKLELWRVPTPVPTACVRFRMDLGQSLDWQLRDKYPNLVQSSWYSVGGHFAAMEVPGVLYADLLAFVAKVEMQ